MSTLSMPRSLVNVLLLLVGLLCSGAVDAQDPSPEPGEPSAAMVEQQVVVLETSLGTMVIEFAKGAPQTISNFKRLVAEGFYEGLPFYRVVAGHVIQAGDGGENDQPTVPGEFGALPHLNGVVGLARGEAEDSGSTEFYICVAPRPHLDGRYATFGRVVEGLDVLAAIAGVAVEEQWLNDGQVAFHKPLTPVLIESARLENRPAQDPVVAEE
jgi:cyclophilin family peptidyl-prolyl cis-trans isomerase